MYFNAYGVNTKYENSSNGRTPLGLIAVSKLYMIAVQQSVRVESLYDFFEKYDFHRELIFLNFFKN